MNADDRHVRTDVLSAGSPERQRRGFRGVGVLVGVALVVGLAGSFTDRTLRHHEFSTLVSRSVDSRTTAEHAIGVVRSTRFYTMPLLTSSTPDVRRGLAQVIADSAVQGVREMQTERAAVASTTVLPWHTAMRAAKRAELSYLDAWTAYLARVATDGDISADPSQSLDVQWRAALATLRAASPNHQAAQAIPSSP